MRHNPRRFQCWLRAVSLSFSKGPFILIPLLVPQIVIEEEPYDPAQILERLKHKYSHLDQAGQCEDDV